MLIDAIEHPDWGPGWRCRRDELELVAATSLGPRIVSLRLGDGPNVLFEDRAGHYGRGPWRLWGGHRLWVTPESEATYELDNDPCESRIEDGRLVLERPAGPSALRRRIEVSPSSRCAGFRLRHMVINEGGYPVVAAPWAITCVRPEGRIIIPWGVGPESWRMRQVRYWGRWGPLSTNPASPQWQPADDRFVIEPRGEWGKVGLACDGGALAHLLPGDLAFVKWFDFDSAGPYPDGGCNVQVFTGFWVELETLGAVRELAPGLSASHDEHWLLAPAADEPTAWELMATGLFS